MVEAGLLPVLRVGVPVKRHAFLPVLRGIRGGCKESLLTAFPCLFFKDVTTVGEDKWQVACMVAWRSTLNFGNSLNIRITLA